MKVDLGTCTVCGAKNSKFVEACYKCGAALPWAPGYVAPAPQRAPAAQPAPQPAPKPRPTPQPVSNTRNDAKTVVSTPVDFSQPENKASIADRASKSIQIPTWAIVAGVLGCVVLGVALTMAFGNRNSTPTVVVVPTPVPSPTISATPTSTPIPVPTMPPAVPTQVPVPVVAPTANVPNVAQQFPAPAQVRTDLTFDVVDAKMDGRSQGLTEAQKQSFWQNVAGSTVRWRGALIEARLSGGGELTLRCGKQTITSDVRVTLDGSQIEMLGQLNKGENITIEGVLQEHSMNGYDISQARIVSRN